MHPPGQPAVVDLQQEQRAEARRIEETADFSAQVQFEAAKSWSALDGVLTLGAAIAAFASGAATLQGPSAVALAGLLAFGSGALAAAATVVRGQDKAYSSVRAGRSYRRVRDRARVFVNLDTRGGESSSVTGSHLAEIIRAYDDADELAPVVGWAFWAVWRARRNIRNGLTRFGVDKRA